jgi:hypothetical protein
MAAAVAERERGSWSMTDEVKRFDRPPPAQRAAYRSTTLYSTSRPAGGGSDTPVPIADTLPASELGATGQYRRWFEDGALQLPAVAALREHAAHEVLLHHAPAVLGVVRAWTWLFATPFGGFVAGLTLDFVDRDRPGEVHAFPRLFDDVDGGRDDIEIAGRPLIDACTDGLPAAAGLQLGPDMHNILMLPPNLAGTRLEVDLDVLQRLVSRRDEASRQDFLTVRLPPEGNRYADMLLGVTPGATAVAGQPHSVEVALTLCAVQALAALSSLRQMQRRAFAMLFALRNASADVTRSAAELQQLELDLSFAVEAYLDVRPLIPSLPVEQYHDALVEALRLPRGAETTGGMVERLVSAFELRRSDDDQRRQRFWSAVGGAVAFVAIPLGVLLSFLGISADEVRPKDSFLDPHYLPYYGALLTLLGLAVLGGVAYVRRNALKAGVSADLHRGTPTSVHGSEREGD